MFWDPEEEHPTKGARRIPAHDVPLVYVRLLWAYSARRELSFFCKQPLPPLLLQRVSEHTSTLP